jgi:hypothetical protein
MLRIASSLVARPRLLPCLPASSALWSPLQHRLFSRRGPPRVLSAADAAASLRPWHTSDIVAYENLRPRIFQTITFLGSTWFAFNVWQGYDFVTSGLGTGLMIPLVSMGIACVLLATTLFFAKSSICRITLLRGGQSARISRHNLLGGVVDQECSVHLIRLLSDPMFDDKQKMYRFRIDAADGSGSSGDLILDRGVRA